MDLPTYVVLALLVGTGTPAPADPVLLRGIVLDTPAPYRDGTTRFHLLEPWANPDGTMIPVPVAGILEEEVLLDLAAESAPEHPWRDLVGTMRREKDVIVAAGPRDVIAFEGVTAPGSRVTFTAKASLQCGVVGHLADADNFVLAFYSPEHRIVGFHNVRGGNYGPWLQTVSTAHLTGDTVDFEVDLGQDRVTATLRDRAGHQAATTLRPERPMSDGGVGLYYDTGARAGTQRFTNVRVAALRRAVPSNAIEVVLPPEHRGENQVYRPGDTVTFRGIEAPRGAGASRRLRVPADPGPVNGRTNRAVDRLFPIDLPRRDWAHFRATGFSAPACGVIYRLEDTVTNGLALGGIDTGCLDLETTGLLGYATLFNTHVPRRGPINLPILGLSVAGETWVLCDPQPKQGWGGAQVPVEPVLADLDLAGVKTARQIHYWGHYPVADLEFETSAPVSAGLRAWAPFLPGDVKGSMIPAIVFEVRLRNGTAERQTGTLAFSFPGPTNKEAGSETFVREAMTGDVTGVEVKGDLASWALGVIGENAVRQGGELGADGAAWARIHETLPPITAGRAGASAAIDFSLAPGASRVVRYVVSWSAPTWNGGGYNWSERPNTFTHMYDTYYPRAADTARMMAARHEELLRRILAWQQVIYTENRLPVWLRDSLVNVLYLITETAHWAQAGPPLPDWVRPEDGLFGMNECPRGCPQIECIPCSFYGNMPLVYFFPETALSTLRGYQGYQYPDGAPPWIFGGNGPEFAEPTKGYQFASNGISLASLVYRYLLCHDTPDKARLREFYPAVKRAMEWTMGLRTTPGYTLGERVIAMPDPDSKEAITPPTEWFEAAEPGWAGMTAHIGGLHLAQLRITEKMARDAGDTAFAEQCAAWIRAGAKAMEERLWTGSYYLNYLDPATGRRSDFVFGYQLDGEWITDHHGLASALPEDRVLTVLETIKRTNIALTRYGAVNYANPDGTAIRPPRAGTWDYGQFSYFPPEALMLAMTYMYQGQAAFGTELARRVWHNLICQQGYTWDLPNIMRGDVDTGERTFGNDYYQDMMLWSLPAAMAGEDLARTTRPGGLVARIIRAAAE